MNDELYGRLSNWKFEQALQYLEGEPDDLWASVTVLARLFGNCGWFDGDMGELVRLAVRSLGVTD